MSQVAEQAKQKALLKVKKIFQALANPKLVNKVTELQRIEAACNLAKYGNLATFVPMLPLCFNLNGYPYTLHDHFPMEPMFHRRIPEVITIKGGRQISKSTVLAAKTLLMSFAMPHFSTLFVFPLFEQVNRFSTQYVGKFIEESPLRMIYSGQGTNNSVLTKSFSNSSKMTCSFASLSAERIRSIAANCVIFDEAQNLDPRFVPLIKEVLSHSLITDPITGQRRHAKITAFTGTPKTLEGLLEYQWQESSMGEWVVPCLICKKENYPAMGLDLERMIGPMHDNIGEVHDGKKPGTICANSKCGQSINPRDGFWRHRFPNKILNRPGYHIPQIIIPIHYAEPKGWSSLLAKMSGADNYTTVKVYNEVFGESYDAGAKLITETDLKRAATLDWENRPTDFGEAVRRSRNKYIALFMGVDWGGGGETEVSFTTMAVVGLMPSGEIEVVYGRRLLMTHDPLGEASVILNAFNAFNCQYLCHDYNGSGSLHEAYLIQAGLPYENVIPFVYYRSAAKDIVVFHKASDEHHRNYYLLDKARSLKTICELIKLQRIKFFQYDFKDKDNRGLLRDFTSLFEVKVETARAGEVYAIHRNPSSPDDFAHSVNFACCGIWHNQQNWPNLAEIANLRMSYAQQAAWGADQG